jgi:hypothetical protein
MDEKITYELAWMAVCREGTYDVHLDMEWPAYPDRLVLAAIAELAFRRSEENETVAI